MRPANDAMLALLVSAGEQRYALPCSRVREVVSNVALEPLPRAADALAGILNYRGELVPVLDLGLLLADVRCQERLSTRIVMFDQRTDSGETRALGLRAERVTDTKRLKVERRSNVAVHDSIYVTEVLLEEVGLVKLLDLDRIAETGLRRIRGSLAGAGVSDNAALDHRTPA
jgi:chemotaxis-related protein WspB